jgi:hypothetical protein
MDKGSIKEKPKRKMICIAIVITISLAVCAPFIYVQFNPVNLHIEFYDTNSPYNNITILCNLTSNVFYSGYGIIVPNQADSCIIQTPLGNFTLGFMLAMEPRWMNLKAGETYHWEYTLANTSWDFQNHTSSIHPWPAGVYKASCSIRLRDSGIVTTVRSNAITFTLK